MTKKAFGLLFTISILMIVSFLSILILQYKSTTTKLIIKENIYNQAQIHLLSTMKIVYKLDLFNQCKDIINIEDNQFEIKIKFKYITKMYCNNNFYKLEDNDTINQEMIVAIISVKSRIKEYKDIRLTKIVNLYR